MIKIKCSNHGKVHLRKEFAFLSPRITTTRKLNQTNTIRVPFPTYIMSPVVRYMKNHAKADATAANFESVDEDLDVLNYEYEEFARKDPPDLLSHVKWFVDETDTKKQCAADDAGSSVAAPAVTEQAAAANKNMEGDAGSSVAAPAITEQVACAGATGSSIVAPVADELGLVAEEELRAFDDMFVAVDINTLLNLNKAAHYLKIKSMMELTCRAVLLRADELIAIGDLTTNGD